jgi:hypothetical protein
MSVIINGTDGVTFNDASLQGAAASPYVLKNRIINGDMRIDQRNAGASVTPAAAVATYTLDRFYCYPTQASKLTIQQNAGSVTPPAGFTNYLGVTSSSSYTPLSTDAFILVQPIEGFNTADLAFGTANARTVTLSFWVRSSLTGTFGGNIQNAAETQCYPFNYTISAANTWEQKTITIAGSTTGTWNTNNTVGMYVVWDLGSGSNQKGTVNTWQSGPKYAPTGSNNLISTNGATLYITGVQLEQNTSATPFERRLYNQELANCQRYYEVIAASGYGTMGAPAQATGSTAAYGYTPFMVVKRTSPTTTYSGTFALTNSVSGVLTVTSISGAGACTTSCEAVMNVASGLTAGNASRFLGVTNAQIMASAEL